MNSPAPSSTSTPAAREPDLAKRATSSLRLTLAFLFIHVAVLGALRAKQVVDALAVLSPPDDWQQLAARCTSFRLPMEIYLPQADEIARRWTTLAGLFAGPLFALLLATAAGALQRLGYRVTAKARPALAGLSGEETETALAKLEAFQQSLDEAAGRSVEVVLLADGTEAPCTYGSSRSPIVVVRLAWLLDEFRTDGVLRLVARHEAAHVLARDLVFIRLAQAFRWVVVLYVLLDQVCAIVTSGPLANDVHAKDPTAPVLAMKVSIILVSFLQSSLQSAWVLLLGSILHRRAMRARELAADACARDEAAGKEWLEGALRACAPRTQAATNQAPAATRAWFTLARIGTALLGLLFPGAPMVRVSPRERRRHAARAALRALFAAHPLDHERIDAIEGKPVSSGDAAWTMYLTLGAALGLSVQVFHQLQGTIARLSSREVLDTDFDRGGLLLRALWLASDWLPWLAGPLLLFWLFSLVRGATVEASPDRRTAAVRLSSMIAGSVIPWVIAFSKDVDVGSQTVRVQFETSVISAPVLSLIVVITLGTVVSRVLPMRLSERERMTRVALADTLGLPLAQVACDALGWYVMCLAFSGPAMQLGRGIVSASMTTSSLLLLGLYALTLFPRSVHRLASPVRYGLVAVALVLAASAEIVPSAALAWIARRERPHLRRVRLDSSISRRTRDLELGLQWSGMPTGRILAAVTLRVPLVDEAIAHVTDRQRGLQTPGLIDSLRFTPTWVILPWDAPLERALFKTRRAIAYGDVKAAKALLETLPALALEDDDGWRVLDALDLVHGQLGDAGSPPGSVFWQALDRLRRMPMKDEALRAETFAFHYMALQGRRSLAFTNAETRQRLEEDAAALRASPSDSRWREALSRARLRLALRGVARGAWLSSIAGEVVGSPETLSLAAQCREQLTQHLAAAAEMFSGARPDVFNSASLGVLSEGCEPKTAADGSVDPGELEDDELAASIDLRKLQGTSVPEESIRWDRDWLPLHHVVGFIYSRIYQRDIAREKRDLDGLSNAGKDFDCAHFVGVQIEQRGIVPLWTDRSDKAGIYNAVFAHIYWSEALNAVAGGRPVPTEFQGLLDITGKEDLRILTIGVSCALKNGPCTDEDGTPIVSRLRMIAGNASMSGTMLGLAAYLASEIESGAPSAKAVVEVLYSTDSSSPPCIHSSWPAWAYGVWRMSRLAYLRGDRKLAKSASECARPAAGGSSTADRCWIDAASVYRTVLPPAGMWIKASTEKLSEIVDGCSGNAYPAAALIADAILFARWPDPTPKKLQRLLEQTLTTSAEGRGLMTWIEITQSKHPPLDLQQMLSKAVLVSPWWQIGWLRQSLLQRLIERPAAGLSEEEMNLATRLMRAGPSWSACENFLTNVAVRPLEDSYPAWLDRNALKKGCIRADEADEARRSMGRAVLCRDHADEQACRELEALKDEAPVGWSKDLFRSFVERVRACRSGDPSCKDPWAPPPLAKAAQ